MGPGRWAPFSHLLELGDGFVHPLDVLLDRVLPVGANEAFAARQCPWSDHAQPLSEFRRWGRTLRPARGRPCGPLAAAQCRAWACAAWRPPGTRPQAGWQTLPASAGRSHAGGSTAAHTESDSAAGRRGPRLAPGLVEQIKGQCLQPRTAGLRQWPFTKVGTACRASARSRSSSCGDAILDLARQLAEKIELPRTVPASPAESDGAGGYPLDSSGTGCCEESGPRKSGRPAGRPVRRKRRRRLHVRRR